MAFEQTISSENGCSLLFLAEIDKTASNPRKFLQATEIKKSEERVMKVVEALKEDFINPFDSALDRQKLFNLVSGRPLPTDVAELLISAEDRGKGLQLEFNKRLDSDDGSGTTFYDPIKSGKALTVLTKKRKSPAVVNRETSLFKETF